MAKLNDVELKNILSKLLLKSLSNPGPAKEIVEQAMADDDFKKQVSLLCEAYMIPKLRESKLIAKSIDIRALTSLIEICRRENIGIIPIDFSGDYKHVYTDDEKISVLILSGQLNEFNKIILEANAVSGTISEMERPTADLFAKKLKDSNPMIEITGVKKETYEIMKKNMAKLPYEMRFTLFPDEVENKKVNVGFFTKTEPIIIKKGSSKETTGPYAIPKIASVLLASAILEKPDLEKKYKKIQKRNMELMKEIMDMYYEKDEPYYLVPATIKREGYNVFMDQAYYIDYYENVDTHEMDGFIAMKFSSLNHTLVPMTVREFDLYKNEIMINPNSISFYNSNQAPGYTEPEEMLDKDMSESLIEMLNRKREQVLLMSDDFNGKNLMNLDNYIAATVHEIITREDEDFTDWLEVNEQIDTREMELLSDLEESYSMTTVYESHDKVTELINNERTELESLRSKSPDHEELSL